MAVATENPKTKSKQTKKQETDSQTDRQTDRDTMRGSLEADNGHTKTKRFKLQ